MKNNFPKILMLGWEFPPIINGGLGVACHDLSNAMSSIADITMIVPKTSPDFKMQNLNLVGINNLNADSFPHFPSNYHKPHSVKFHAVPANLNPYYSQPHEGASHYSGEGFISGKKMLESFNMESLYGGDVINKVMQYAEITASLAGKMEFDVIHAHDWMTMIAGMKIKEQSGKPLVTHIHSLEIDRCGEESRGWLYELEKAGMEYSDLLIPVSNFTSGNIQKHYGISSDKIAVVHNGSTIVNAYRSRKRFREKTVLFVGRLTRQKGPEKFVDIASKVLEKDPGVRFIMAGVGDNYRSIIEKSSYNSIGNRFHMTGFLNSKQLHYLFSLSDVYCMPSVSEPFGLSAIEAAQFKIPCVISKQSGVSEVLNGALKFDHWDVNRAASCILSLLQDKVLRKKVVEDAAQNLRNVSWNISANKIINAYSSFKLI